MTTVQLTTDGKLPAGVHQQAWEDFEVQFGFSLRRAAILGRVVLALQHLAQAGVRRVFVGGSFVTTKRAPKDMDVLYDTTGADASAVHPLFLDLSREGRIVMLSTFGAEFFPADLIEGSTDKTMLEFFQQTRDGQPVGVIEIDLSTLPQP